MPKLEGTYIVPDHVSTAAFSADGRWLAVGAGGFLQFDSDILSYASELTHEIL